MGVKGQFRFRRVLLKLSGEALQGEDSTISRATIARVSEEISEVHRKDVEVALVIGGGNIFRGLSLATSGMERATADYMGMLATTINALALQDALEKVGLETRVLSAIEMRQIAEPYIRRRAVRHIEKGRVVIFAAGTGNPYFTTDTAASLRAMEIGADAILKATKVDGVYDRDPLKEANAQKFSKLSYLDALNRGLKVMDATAISLCMDNKLPIVVFSMGDPGSLKEVLLGEAVGTVVGAAETEPKMDR